MTIDRQHNTLIFSCDRCEETFEPDTNDFVDAWAEARGKGWKARKVGNAWVHACPDCEVDG